MAGAGLETPQPFAGARVEREEVTLRIAAEHDVARGGQPRGENPGGGGHSPLAVARNGIVCGDIPLDLSSRRRLHLPTAADEGLAFGALFVARRQIVADLLHRKVEPAGAQGIGALIPVLGADGTGAHEFRFANLRLQAIQKFAKRNSCAPVPSAHTSFVLPISGSRRSRSLPSSVIPLTQLTWLAKRQAFRKRPVTRSITHTYPALVGCMRTFRVWPLMGRSARISSKTAS